MYLPDKLAAKDMAVSSLDSDMRDILIKEDKAVEEGKVVIEDKDSLTKEDKAAGEDMATMEDSIAMEDMLIMADIPVEDNLIDKPKLNTLILLVGIHFNNYY